MPPPIPRCSNWPYSSLNSPSCFSLPRYGSRIGLRIVLCEMLWGGGEEIASIVADATDGGPNAKAERPEPIPYRPETGQHIDRGDRPRYWCWYRNGGHAGARGPLAEIAGSTSRSALCWSHSRTQRERQQTAGERAWPGGERPRTRGKELVGRAPVALSEG